ncbi:hypothetical protein FSARC_12131 [Fusarium sarcochroum]|uniref:Uncharacterized protein n=1 Tax=Fusarium sarcochroum TaxID=1208366 RepID=A0A8H4TAV1_9HYPO|nr:hypothetical protein FSARC_12131 [Fusarium sarcochroum]
MRFATMAGLALGIVGPAVGRHVPREADPAIPFLLDEMWNRLLLRPSCRIVHDRCEENSKESEGAISFCVSHLHIPFKTSTYTITSYTKTIKNTVIITSGSAITTDVTVTITQNVTGTATGPTTITNTITETETIEAVLTSSITSCASPTASVQKRGVTTVPKPKCFKFFRDAGVITKACHCLTIPSSMKTTITKCVSIPTTTTATVTVPACQDATVTTTVTHNDTITITNTATTNTTTYTSTTFVLAVPSFNIYAIGGENDGNPLRGDINAPNFVDVDNPTGAPILEFTLGNDTTLQVLNGPRAGTKGGTDPVLSNRNVYVEFGNDDFVDLSCTVTGNNDGTCPMSCQGSRGSISYDCGALWRNGNSSDVQGCSAFTPYAVEV